MRIPHNRKWPIYTMEVGASFTVERPPRRLRQNVYGRAARHGIVLSTRLISAKTGDFVVTRRA